MARLPKTAMSRARRFRTKPGDKNFKDFLTKFDRMMLIRKSNAKAIAAAGVQLPNFLRNSIVRPRRDRVGKRTENEWWMRFLEKKFPKLAEKQMERECRKGYPLSESEEEEEEEV